MRLPAALPGRPLEAGGNAGPRGMFAAAGKATTRRDRTRLTGRLWPFPSNAKALRLIRELPRLRKFYGRGRRRKMKGLATIRLPNGRIREAELHWYEAHGIGRKEFKIKRLLPST